MSSNMKKKAIEIKKGSTIIIGGEELFIEETEVSDISKQGTKKVRFVAKRKTGEKIILIRPADYPIDLR